MVSKVKTLALVGLDGIDVEVETDATASDQFSLDIVGLPDASVKESKERLRAAAQNSGFRLPSVHVVINLAPASLRKEGPSYDLAMVLGYLSATGQMGKVPEDAVFFGEMSLTGEVRPCSGVLAAVISAKQNGYKACYVPARNAAEGAVIEGIRVYGVDNLCALVSHLNGRETLTPARAKPLSALCEESSFEGDFADIVGQQTAKRACEIAAAGGHNLLLIGPPGTGKSMLAKALPSILPDMTFEEMLQSSKIYSVAGALSDRRPLVTKRPFVKTTQSVSTPALTGGGSVPGPGVISMAHNGVLFLDEVAEFSPSVLDSLRQPLEDNCVTISRVRKTVTYPASFTLVCAMNPCPCGHYGHPVIPCTCSPSERERYLGRISGPMLDRIDLLVEMPPVPVSDIRAAAPAEPSSVIRARVNKARERQAKRYAGTGYTANAKIPPSLLNEKCKASLTPDAEAYVQKLFSAGYLSMRAYDKIVRIARTVADLEGCEAIETRHVAEAAFFRSADTKYWNR